MKVFLTPNPPIKMENLTYPPQNEVALYHGNEISIYVHQGKAHLVSPGDAWWLKGLGEGTFGIPEEYQGQYQTLLRVWFDCQELLRYVFGENPEYAEGVWYDNDPNYIPTIEGTWEYYRDWEHQPHCFGVHVCHSQVGIGQHAGYYISDSSESDFDAVYHNYPWATRVVETEHLLFAGDANSDWLIMLKENVI